MPKMVQIRNMPDDLHRKMKARAAAAGMSLSDYLLNEVRMAAERPTMEEFKARLARLPPVTLSESVEDAVRAERDSR
jgi:plasmid stability protein